MKNEIYIHPLAQSRIEEFFIYLKDHISDNGQAQTSLFIPISRKDLDIPAGMMESFRKGQALPLDGLGWRRIFIAENTEKEIVGHIDLRSHNQAYTQHRAIMGMGVHREYRKLGLGRLLIESIEIWVKEKTELEWIDLWVLSENKPAIRLYEKMGFHKVGEVENMFKIDGAALSYKQMTKQVP